MKKSVFALSLIAVLLSCKKDKKDDIIPTIVKEPTHEMMIITTPQLNDLGWGTQKVYAAISDFEGNVLDFKELVPGTTNIISTGDPSIKYFDFHLFNKADGQFIFTAAGSYHNVTGDTLYYGSNFNTLPNSHHSSLKVEGVPPNIDEILFESGNGGVDIYSGGGSTSTEINCEIEHSSDEPVTMYLTYGKHGDEKYRFYWNKNVPKSSNLVVQHEDLAEIAPLATVNFPQELDFSYLYVFGKPKEGTTNQVLASSDIEGTNAVPVFIPKNFATDLQTDITARSATAQYHSIIKSDNIPSQYVAPVADFNVTATPGIGFTLTGSGFDTYNYTFVDANLINSWSVIGPYEADMRFKFPLLTDDQKTLLGVDQTQLTATPTYQSVTKNEPSLPYFYSLPSSSNNEQPFERRDIISKL